MKEAKLNTAQEIEKNQGLWGKIGDFFEEIGYNIAKFAAEHPFITKAAVITLSSAAGYFTGGGILGAVGGFTAGIQRAGDVVEACEKFVDEYEEKIAQKDLKRANSEARAHSQEIGHALSVDKHLEKNNSQTHENHHHHALDVKNHQNENGQKHHELSDILAERKAHNKDHHFTDDVIKHSDDSKNHTH